MSATHAYVVTFEFNTLYESNPSEIVGVATSLKKAREIAERHFADPLNNKHHRPNDNRPLVWQSPAVDEDAYQFAELPWDDSYTYEIVRAPLED